MCASITSPSPESNRRRSSRSATTPRACPRPPTATWRTRSASNSGSRVRRSRLSFERGGGSPRSRLWAAAALPGVRARCAWPKPFGGCVSRRLRTNPVVHVVLHPLPQAILLVDRHAGLELFRPALHDLRVDGPEADPLARGGGLPPGPERKPPQPPHTPS